MTGGVEAAKRGVMAIDLDELLEDPRVLWVEDVIRFRDTDMNGHVNNSTFAVFAESGRVNYFRTRVTPTGREHFYSIARLAIDFRRELHYPGRVRTGTWLSRLGRSSIGIAQVILAPDGGVAAETEAVCVHMDRATRRPKPFPDGVRAAVEPLVRAAASAGD